ncbi:MAG: hypothetical protein QOJ89_831 [bacterium]
MRHAVERATGQVTATRDRVAGLPFRDVAIAQIEDVLGMGYAQALAADAWLMRAEHRLHELIDDASPAGYGRELRRLAGERIAVREGVCALRDELARLRGEHDRVRSGPISISA